MAYRPAMAGASDAWQGDHPWAKLYDRVSSDERVGPLLWRLATASPVAELHRRAGLALAAVPSGGHVLDIPCGGGVLLRDLPDGHDLTYVAADISPAMLRRTRAEADRLGLTGARTQDADVQALDDADATYDLVLTFTGLHCFPDPAAAVRELFRVLRPGGSIVGSAFVTDAGLRWKPVHAAGRAIGVLGPGGTHDDVGRWLHDAGFADARLHRSGAFTYFSALRP